MMLMLTISEDLKLLPRRAFFFYSPLLYIYIS